MPYLGNYRNCETYREEAWGINPAVLGRRKWMKGIQMALFLIGCGIKILSMIGDD